MRLCVDFFILWRRNGDLVRKRNVWASLSLWVKGSHDLHLDTNDTLTEEDVTAGRVHVVTGWLTGVDHETINKLHGLGTLSTELAGDDDFATLCAVFNNETDDTVARTSDGKSAEELVSEGFALGDGGEATVGDLFGVELDRVLVEVESLLDERSKFTNSTSLFAEDVLGSGGQDDDLGTGWGDTDLNARVAVNMKGANSRSTFGDEVVAAKLAKNIAGESEKGGGDKFHACLGCGRQMLHAEMIRMHMQPITSIKRMQGIKACNTTTHNRASFLFFFFRKNIFKKRGWDDCTRKCMR